VKRILKLVHICQSYHKKTAWVFYFDSQCSNIDDDNDKTEDNSSSTCNSSCSDVLSTYVRAKCNQCD